MDSPYNPPQAPVDLVPELVQSLVNWGERLDAVRDQVPAPLQPHYDQGLEELGVVLNTFARLQDPLWRMAHPATPDAPHAGAPEAGGSHKREGR